MISWHFTKAKLFYRKGRPIFSLLPLSWKEIRLEGLMWYTIFGWIHGLDSGFLYKNSLSLYVLLPYLIVSWETPSALEKTTWITRSIKLSVRLTDEIVSFSEPEPGDLKSTPARDRKRLFPQSPVPIPKELLIIFLNSFKINFLLKRNINDRNITEIENIIEITLV